MVSERDVVDAERRKRAMDIVEVLKAAYPDVGSALTFQNPLQCLIATILSAQCTDVRVNLVTPALFEQYRDAEAFAAADPGELEEMIRSTGFFRNKARNIVACCREIVEKHGGRVPEDMAALVALPGVGRKTANCVIGNAYNRPAVMVDTHVKRLAARMGLTESANPDIIEFDLKALLLERDWTRGSLLLIHHGRKVCMARSPRCGDCVVRRMCPRIGVSKD